MPDAELSLPGTTAKVLAVYALQQTTAPSLASLGQPVGRTLAEQLAVLLEEAGHAVVWLRFGPETADPEKCLAMLIQATQHLRPVGGAPTLTAMTCQPDSLYGWLPYFNQLIGELVARLPPHTAFLLENVCDLSPASATYNLLKGHVLSALAGRWLCMLLPPDAPTLLEPPIGEKAIIAARAVTGKPEAAPAEEPLQGSNPKPAADEALAPAASTQASAVSAAPTLHAYLLGKFRVVINDQAVGRWPASRGLAVFKYLLANHEWPTPREVLMDRFWPDAYEPKLARNNLNVAISGLRRALRALTERPVVVFEGGAYQLNPDFRVWVDVEEFDRHLHRAQQSASNRQATAALSEYEAALSLYSDDFLADDPYEEWPVVQRERLRVAYLNALDRVSELHLERGEYAACVSACQTLLARDACREDIHCRLMLCYARQDQHPLALRQYQTCVEALKAELQVAPAPATTQLYQRLRRRERV